MPIKISLADEPQEIDAVLKLRHTVFSEEEELFSATSDHRVMDRYDTFSTSKNLIAVSDGAVIGSMRLTLDSEAGIPADEYYDFRRLLPEYARILNCGMYCVTKPFRGAKIAIGLNLMASYFGVSNDVTHVVAPINPVIAKLVGRIGFKPVDEIQYDPAHGVEFLPMVLDIRELTDYFLTFAENNRLYNFISSYECLFYAQGEHVVRSGEMGDAAFVIIEGHADVVTPDNDQHIARIGPGEVFGELALLTDDVRSADIVAASDIRVMRLPKEAFLEHLRNHPDHAMNMLKSIGSRMKNMLKVGS